MGKQIRLRKGFDINLAGQASPTIASVDQPELFAVKPPDIQGIYLPRMLVKEGDIVKAGTPLYRDKRYEHIAFTAPASGEIVEIKRGEKRRLLEVKILPDRSIDYLQFQKYSTGDLANLDRATLQKQMLTAGVWGNLVQRPFGVLADPEETPKAIFISAFDSHPLAPDFNLLFKGEEQYFQAGVDVLKKFTSGVIHLNVNADGPPSVFSNTKGVELNQFSGPHPAGCVGVQIHHLDPINRGEIVWTIHPGGVIQIGKLFLNGIYDASRIVALAGSEVRQPQYYKTYLGASISKMIANNLNSDHVRCISGNVLTGRRIEKDGFIGFFDHLITVIPEGDYHEFLGWISHTPRKLSFQRAWGLLSFLNRDKAYVLDSNTHGEPRAFVQTGIFEKVTPMDVLPTYLLKAIIAEDFDEMEALGIYEVIEEDLALCDFVDVSKHNIQGILREGIELIRNS